ncbi:hypothetical protein [Sphingorhabdus sp.]|uniref:hypothetical protein n=1 Tax=Sphingorhabdus sp. TaxID=1902408 RepID=UPI0039833961
MKNSRNITDSAIATLFTTSENRDANKHRYISQVAKDNKSNGLEVIEYGTSGQDALDQFGLFGLVGVVAISTVDENVTKPQIIEKMQSCAPQLDDKFCCQLIEILTGTNPDTHMLKVRPDGTYTMIDMT